MEVWKGIKEYEGFYQVSNKGRVKRLKGYSRTQEKVLKPFLCGQGVQYYKVRLYKKGKGKDKSISRLMAETFLDNPNNYPEVRHLDGNSKNNVLENLAFGTHKMNMQDSIKHGTFRTPDNKGEKNGMSKLSVSDVLKIRKLRKNKKYTYQKIADMFGVSSATVYSIVFKRSWKQI